MNLQRLSIKYPLRQPVVPDLSAVVPVFHAWIRAQAVEGLLLDVTNYSHVPDGPGILLIGHEGDYSLDLQDGWPGLRYTRKRDLGPLADALQTALRLGQQAYTRLEEALGWAFDAAVVEVAFLDRLRVPNHPDTLDLIRADLLAALRATGDAPAFDLTVVHADLRFPFTVKAERLVTQTP